MIIKSKDFPAHAINVVPTPAADNGVNDGFTYDPVMFDTTTASMLLSIFDKPDDSEERSKTASVKFMITMQDEMELRGLGYSQAQIDTLKPQEAEDILRAGAKVSPAE
ncbi:MAG: hypothetical protein A2076_07885 [Geobacteraceae bacterium GWC2_53_11]|nr:MAG: hypothetical protein A2076_07885 [Geobacteraceae bacterium GWC2_53_11]